MKDTGKMQILQNRGGRFVQVIRYAIDFEKIKIEVVYQDKKSRKPNVPFNWVKMLLTTHL